MPPSTPANLAETPPPTPARRGEPAPPLPSGPSCANCGTSLAGPYCVQCGQHAHDYHRSVWRFLGDFFENTFCWDNKILLTLTPLLRRPGSLTREFMAGRRVRYVHPLKLFLFTSAVCLALIGFIHQHGGAQIFRGSGRSAAEKSARHLSSDDSKKVPSTPAAVAGARAASATHDADDDEDDAAATPARADKSPAIIPAQIAPSFPGSSPGAVLVATPVPDSSAVKTSPVSIADRFPDSATPARGLGITPSPSPGASSPVSTASRKPATGQKKDLGDRIEQLVDANLPQDGDSSEIARQKIEKITRRFGSPEQMSRMVEEIKQGVEQRLSWVALALLPVFALFVRAMYWRRDSYYFEHLVFSLHYHAFLFIFWASYVLAGVLIAFLPLRPLWNLLLVCVLPLPVWYLYAALRRMYGESRRRTTAKVLVISSLHVLSILLGVSIVGAVAFFSLQ